VFLKKAGEYLKYINVKSKDQVCVDMSGRNYPCKNEQGCHRKKESNLFRVPYRAKGTVSIILNYALYKAGSLTVKTL